MRAKKSANVAHERFGKFELGQHHRWTTIEPPVIVSFDVFDTVLTRPVAPPQAMFLLLGRQLHKKGYLESSPEAFARARFRAEMRAFARAGGRDSNVGLDQIYSELAIGFGLNERMVKTLIHMEEKLESALIVACPVGLRLLERWRQMDRTIVFLSDMYLSKDFIVQQLASRHLWQPGDNCYVSSEYAASKSTGALFRHLLEREQLSPANLVHYGDDPRSDVSVPRSLGVRAVHLGAAQPNQYEQILGRYSFDTEGLSSAFAGAARITRLKVPAETEHEINIRDVSAGVAAPLLTGFILWLLRQAQQLSLRRIYFLSRDGQILMSMANQVAQRLGIGIEFVYLYGSRRSWNLASLDLRSRRNLDWIWTHRRDETVVDFLTTLGYSQQRIVDVLNEMQIPQSMWHKPPTSDFAAKLEFELVSGPAASSLIDDAKKSRQALLAYLRSKQALSDENIGLVDLGGVGSQLQAFNLMRVEAGLRPASLFLLYREQNEISPDAAQDWNECPPRAYLFDESTNHGIERFSGMIPFLETFCTADHGTVREYQIEPTPSPIVEFNHSSALSAWGLRKHREAIECFIETVVLDEDLVNIDADTRESTIASLRRFVTQPTKSEAKAWGSFPFEVSDDGSSVVANLAKSYEWTEVFRSHREGERRRKWFHWREGSLALTGGILGIILRGAYFGPATITRVLRRIVRLSLRRI